MMDLGATICTSRNPACGICPLRADCAAVLTADPAAFPVKAAKKAKPHRLGHAFWIERADGHVWLARRPDKGLLGGMRGLPGSVWSDAPDPTPPFAGPWRRLEPPVAHVFTHFSLALTVHAIQVNQDHVPSGAGEWWPIDRLADAGLPTLFVRAAETAIREREASDARH